MNKEDLAKKRTAVIGFLYYGLICAAVFFGAWLTVTYLIPALFPLLIAYPVALVLNPIMLFLEKKLKLNRKLGAFVLVTVSVAAVFFGLFAIAGRMMREIGRLADSLSTLTSEDFDGIKAHLNALLLHLPGVNSAEDLEGVWQKLGEHLTDAAARSIPGLIDSIELITGLFTGVLDFVLAFFVTVVSCYYMTVDRATISGMLYKLFPKSMEGRIRAVRQALIGTVGKYVKAYALIMLITFTEVFVSFTVLRVEYAFLLAALTAFIDILPVLGTGMVLIPWALFCLFVTGNVYLGAGLLISYVVITLIRQVLEPKIVGSYIGLHPLVTLGAMFAGLKLFGFWGLIGLPVAIITAKSLCDKPESKRAD